MGQNFQAQVVGKYFEKYSFLRSQIILKIIAPSCICMGFSEHVHILVQLTLTRRQRRKMWGCFCPRFTDEENLRLNEVK